MKYWPLTVLKQSPLMPPAYVWELCRFYSHPPSRGAFDACLNVAAQTQPVRIPGLVAVETVDASTRFIFTEHPRADEWARLERVGVVENSEGGLLMTMDALH